MDNSTGRMGVGIISAGKVGSALGSALRAAGHTIVGAYASSEESRERLELMLPGVPALEVPRIVECSELVILALPDSELAPLVDGLRKLGAWQPGQIVLHTSPRFGTEVLEGAQASGALTLALHPVMEFTGTSMDVARLSGARFVVSAANVLQPIGLALAAEMGGEGVVVNSADRQIYAAALDHAADGIKVALTQASRVLGEIGVEDPSALLRMWAGTAFEQGLVAREGRGYGVVPAGELVVQRVAALDTLAAESPELSDVALSHRHVLAALVDRALAQGLLSKEAANELHTIVGNLRGPSGGR
ncbi:Rossmann-like and DUF2520 domain-containing protein [Trueperella pecoris]|uniref:Rossmann-like and DUF2520 domain-containing protein n=1 Tax=Trueperella pecoris TaxID=2733571 RepID=UPI001FE7A743|nr:NAD(P)-binding domain-containing protein [Trueperella pecoris]